VKCEAVGQQGKGGKGAIRVGDPGLFYKEQGWGGRIGGALRDIPPLKIREKSRLQLNTGGPPLCHDNREKSRRKFRGRGTERIPGEGKSFRSTCPKKGSSS